MERGLGRTHGLVGNDGIEVMAGEPVGVFQRVRVPVLQRDHRLQVLRVLTLLQAPGVLHAETTVDRGVFCRHLLVASPAGILGTAGTIQAIWLERMSSGPEKQARATGQGRYGHGRSKEAKTKEVRVECKGGKGGRRVKGKGRTGIIILRDRGKVVVGIETSTFKARCWATLENSCNI